MHNHAEWKCLKAAVLAVEDVRWVFLYIYICVCVPISISSPSPPASGPQKPHPLSCFPIWQSGCPLDFVRSCKILCACIDLNSSEFYVWTWLRPTDSQLSCHSSQSQHPLPALSNWDEDFCFPGFLQNPSGWLNQKMSAKYERNTKLFACPWHGPVSCGHCVSICFARYKDRQDKN